MLLLGVPRCIDCQEVEGVIIDHKGVCCVHDLHIWTIASGLDAVSVHVVVADGLSIKENFWRKLYKVSKRSLVSIMQKFRLKTVTG